MTCVSQRPVSLSDSSPSTMTRNAAKGSSVELIAVTPVLTVVSRAWFRIVYFFASIRDHSADAFRWQKIAVVFATYF